MYTCTHTHQTHLCIINPPYLPPSPLLSYRVPAESRGPAARVTRSPNRMVSNTKLRDGANIMRPCGAVHTCTPTRVSASWLVVGLERNAGSHVATQGPSCIPTWWEEGSKHGECECGVRVHEKGSS